MNERQQLALKCQRDPVFFFKEVLGVQQVEDYQREVLEALRDNERVAVKACHDVGKSFLSARAMAWFLSCFPYSKVITTAPTFNQVKNILWAELRSAHSKSKVPLGGKLNQTKWELSPNGDWFGIGFTARKEAGNESEGQGTQSSFQGFHAEDLLIIFDEATGIPEAIWTMAEGMLTSGRVKFLAIGNPTSRGSEFFKCFKGGWRKITINCFNSPNLIASGITNKDELQAEVLKYKSLSESDQQEMLLNYPLPRPYLLTAKWVVRMVAKWGMDHPLTQGKILGEFPEVADGSLISLGSVEDAQLRFYDKPKGRKTIGVDVARFGTDASVLTGLNGKQQTHKQDYHKRDTTEISGEVVAMARAMGDVDVIVVDGTGLGSGVVDSLRQAQREGFISKDTEIREVQFGEGVECNGGESCEHKDCDKAKYVNLKARMFDLLGDAIKAEDGLALLKHDIYTEELPVIRYKYDCKGRMFIESKDEFKRRTGRGSPDSADSLALANFGHYDALTIGTFSKSTNESTEYNRPLAAGLGSGREW